MCLVSPAMTPPATDLPLTPRERMRWRRAMDAQLIEAIFGRVMRDTIPSELPLPVPDPAILSASQPSR